MKIAYFDCFSGISGDMILGALLDIGVNIDIVNKEIGKLNLHGYDIYAERTTRCSISGTKVSVDVDISKQHHTSYRHIKKNIEESCLKSHIKSKVLNIFYKIAKAESRIHGISIEDIHFHEVGSVDSIVDIVGSVVAIDALGVDKIISSPINTGEGQVKTEHGTFPIPAPATIELLKGIPCYSKGVKKELTTPTGAAIIAEFAEDFCSLPEIRISETGYGAGTHNPENFPNMLRIICGEIKENIKEFVMLETNIDDTNPEFYEYIIESCFSSGALDVFMTPLIMKKGRPATKLSVLTERNKVDKLTSILFKETSTFGIRINHFERVELEREIVNISTRFGEIRVKMGSTINGLVTVSPEYEDCKKSANRYKIPIKEVYEEAKFKAQKINVK